jgi:ATP-dependent phosphoenolpyruvate carboxykinase
MLSAFDSGFEKIKCSDLRYNLSATLLVEHALANKEGHLSSTGSFVVNTGKYTGRSPNDKFLVDDEAVKNEIAWGKINIPISGEKFEAILGKAQAFMWPTACAELIRSMRLK